MLRRFPPSAMRSFELLKGMLALIDCIKQSHEKNDLGFAFGRGHCGAGDAWGFGKQPSGAVMDGAFGCGGVAVRPISAG